MRTVLRRWPRWSPWVALAVSLAYGVSGLLWWRGASWYPFADVAPTRSSASLIEGAPASVVGPLFSVAGALGVASALVMIRRPSWRGFPLVLAVGLVIGTAATFVVPDYTPLALIALWPAFVVFAFTGIPGDQVGLADILYWHRVNLVILFLGGIAWLLATVSSYRWFRGRCTACGRGRQRDRPDPEATAVATLRMGRTGVWVAVVATLPYDVTRIAWFFGWPLGLSDELYVSLQDPPALLRVGLVLAVLSTGGAALTHGLVADWGTRFPRWIPGLRGRAVPVLLAVAPATTVTITLPPAAIMFAGPQVNGSFDMANWGTWLPSLCWLAWAGGLGLATYAYYLRRRPDCLECTTAPRPSNRRRSAERRMPAGLPAL